MGSGPRRAGPKHRRVRTPTVLQMEALECGAAALASILGYYGLWVPLERMRQETGVSRDGSKASNIAKAARRFGLEANGMQVELAELPSLPLPMIAFWNFNHFVVVEGFGPKRVYLNDPGSGPRTVSNEEFDRSFTGVVLTFAPTAEFKTGGEKPSMVRGLLGRLPGNEMALTFAVLTGLALVMPGLVVPIFNKVFVDGFLVNRMTSWMTPLMIVMGVTAMLMAGLTWLQQKYLLRLEMKLALCNSGKFLWYVLRLPVEFFAQRFSGDLSSRVSINDRVASLLSGELATAVLNIVMIGFYALLMFRYDVVLTLVGVLVAGLNLAALSFISRKRKDQNQKLMQERGKLMGTSMQGLAAIETLKATGLESDFFSRWSGYHAKLLNAQQQLGVSTQVLAAVPPLLSSITTAIILGLGGLQVMDGFLSVGALVAFQSLMIGFTNPVNRMVSLGSSLQEVDGSLKRLDDVLRYKMHPGLSEEEDRPSTSQIGGVRLAGQVELRGVTFGYSRLADPLIRDFSLVVRPGGRVAIVGGSGSGKSTIAKLISGLFDPWEGEILFDGKSRNVIPRSVLANSLAMVDQDIFVFEGTARENLTMWDASRPDADIVTAARDACIHEDISARAGGYETRVAEGGRNLSGGQRQRLEIARALVGNPSIVILDEATSALDAKTEMIVDDNLRRRGCTCFIIAHRLSTIRDCEEIIVLRQGSVVQRGTHEQLMAEGGEYAALIKSE